MNDSSAKRHQTNVFPMRCHPAPKAAPAILAGSTGDRGDLR
jgi:hypothetical protein